MKLLAIHNYYQQAGGERVSYEAQMALLRAHKHQIIQYNRFSSEIEQYNFSQKLKFFLSTVYSLKTYKEITKLLKQERPQIAHVHNVFPLISPSIYWALHDAGIPIVQTIYNFRFLCPNGLFYINGQICERCKKGNTVHAVRFRCFRNSRLLSALYAFTIGLHRRLGTFNLIDAFIVPADFTGNKLVEGGITVSENIHTIKYILPDDVISRTEAHVSSKEPYVVYIGRLSPEKGIWTLLEAFESFNGLKLKILGEGPLLEPIRLWIKQNHARHIDTFGFVSGSTKWEILRKAIATVVPSEWYENSPFSVLESLAAGTLVIGSNVGSMPEIVEDKVTGLLFRAGDSGDLRRKLEWVGSNFEKSTQMGLNAQNKFQIQHTPTGYYNQLMSLYSALIQL